MNEKYIEYENGEKILLDDDDAPELDASFFAEAMPYPHLPQEAAQAVENTRKRQGRPPVEQPKQAISVRLDADVLAWLKSEGNGYQSRINAILREAMQQKR